MIVFYVPFGYVFVCLIYSPTTMDAVACCKGNMLFPYALHGLNSHRLKHWLHLESCESNAVSQWTNRITEICPWKNVDHENANGVSPLILVIVLAQNLAIP